MKLSEAILLSIGVVKNDPKTWLAGYPDCPRGCAIGTAIYSEGKIQEYEKAMRDGIVICEQLWPWTRQLSNKLLNLSIAQEISYRHQTGESREFIAAWIATIEPQEDTPETAPQTQLQEVQDGQS